MNRIIRFNSFNESENYDPSKGQGSSYKENLGRADNQVVHQILPEVEKLIGNDVKTIINKLEAAIRSQSIEDVDTRNIAVAIGHLAYKAMG
jgi:hypothetical protein